MAIKFEKPQVYAVSTWKPKARFVRIKENDDECGCDVDIVVVGGSGFYDLPGLKIEEELRIETPFDRTDGRPSGHFFVGEVNGRRVAFLARHGVAHTIAPHEIAHRSNWWAIKRLNPTGVILVSAMGILSDDIEPGQLVLVDNFIDETRKVHTFTGNGIVAHPSMEPPVCMDLCRILGEKADFLQVPHKKFGTTVTILGPQFSTSAESHKYRSMGLHGQDLIGMTSAPELKYARECEICCAIVAVPTDYDSWRKDRVPVSAAEVNIAMEKYVGSAKQLVLSAITDYPLKRVCACHSSLVNAISTNFGNLKDNVTRAQVRTALRRTQRIFGKYVPMSLVEKD